MRPNVIVILLLAVATLAGCSSTPTKVNVGVIHARTFNFVNRGTKPEPGFVDHTESIHTWIQSAITKNLAARGLSRVSAGGDVTVGYLVITGNNVSTTAISDYFGYREDLGSLHDKAQEIYTGSKNPNHFDAGTLLIDIIDGKNFKLLKRGYASRFIEKGLSPSARMARIQEVVDEILQDVRIAP